jgi:hypothetical protein
MAHRPDFQRGRQSRCKAMRARNCQQELFARDAGRGHARFIHWRPRQPTFSQCLHLLNRHHFTQLDLYVLQFRLDVCQELGQFPQTPRRRMPKCRHAFFGEHRPDGAVAWSEQNAWARADGSDAGQRPLRRMRKQGAMDQTWNQWRLFQHGSLRTASKRGLR